VKILSLFDKSGVMVRPWVDAGISCTIVDIQHPLGITEGNPRRIGADMRTWRPTEHYDIVFAFPPCDHLASSGARWWEGKGEGLHQEALQLVSAALDCIQAATPYYWMIENPQGRLSTDWRPPDIYFDPYMYGGYLSPPGDRYTKKTGLWLSKGFPIPPRKSVHPSEGSRMHKMSSKQKDARSLTPKGFAVAMFQTLYPQVLRQMGGGGGDTVGGAVERLSYPEFDLTDPDKTPTMQQLRALEMLGPPYVAPFANLLSLYRLEAPESGGPMGPNDVEDAALRIGEMMLPRDQRLLAAEIAEWALPDFDTQLRTLSPDPTARINAYRQGLLLARERAEGRFDEAACKKLWGQLDEVRAGKNANHRAQCAANAVMNAFWHDNPYRGLVITITNAWRAMNQSWENFYGWVRYHQRSYLDAYLPAMQQKAAAWQYSDTKIGGKQKERVGGVEELSYLELDLTDPEKTPSLDQLRALECLGAAYLAPFVSLLDLYRLESPETSAAFSFDRGGASRVLDELGNMLLPRDQRLLAADVAEMVQTAILAELASHPEDTKLLARYQKGIQVARERAEGRFDEAKSKTLWHDLARIETGYRGANAKHAVDSVLTAFWHDLPRLALRNAISAGGQAVELVKLFHQKVLRRMLDYYQPYLSIMQQKAAAWRYADTEIGGVRVRPHTVVGGAEGLFYLDLNLHDPEKTPTVDQLRALEALGPAYVAPFANLLSLYRLSDPEISAPYDLTNGYDADHAAYALGEMLLSRDQRLMAADVAEMARPAFYTSDLRDDFRDSILPIFQNGIRLARERAMGRYDKTEYDAAWLTINKIEVKIRGMKVMDALVAAQYAFSHDNPYRAFHNALYNSYKSSYLDNNKFYGQVITRLRDYFDTYLPLMKDKVKEWKYVETKIGGIQKTQARTKVGGVFELDLAEAQNPATSPARLAALYAKYPLRNSKVPSAIQQALASNPGMSAEDLLTMAAWAKSEGNLLILIAQNPVWSLLTLEDPSLLKDQIVEFSDAPPLPLTGLMNLLRKEGTGFECYLGGSPESFIVDRETEIRRYPNGVYWVISSLGFSTVPLFTSRKDAHSYLEYIAHRISSYRRVEEGTEWLKRANLALEGKGTKVGGKREGRAS